MLAPKNRFNVIGVGEAPANYYCDVSPPPESNGDRDDDDGLEKLYPSTTKPTFNR